MGKRPVFTGAVLLALLLWVLFGILKLPSFSNPAASESLDHAGTVLLRGTFLKSEEKSRNAYLFLRDVHCILKPGERETFSGTKTESVSENAGQAALPENNTGEISYKKVLLTMEKDEFSRLKLLPGNQIQVSARKAGFQAARNEGNFDEADYYHSLGIAEKFSASGELKVTSQRYWPVRTALYWLKEKLKQAILSACGDSGDSPAAVFFAIVTGDRSALDTETKDLYRKSGIAHILAISGLHISLLGMGLFSLLRKRLSLLPAALLSGAVMILFCVLSGESASAVRAVLMFLIRLLAILTGRKFDLLSALGLAGILLLLSNPLFLFYSGFQMSFGAILGIGILQPAFEQVLVRQPSGRFSGVMPGGKPDITGRFRSAFSASLAVTLFTLPVIINNYYEIPVFSVFLNLLVVPLMGLVLGSGMFGALAGLFSLIISRFAIGAGVYLVTMVEWLCGLMDRVPFSVVITGHMSPFRVFLYYGFLAGFLVLSRKEKRKRFFLLPGLILLLLFSVFAFRRNRSLLITMFDVDQGECILLESPSGTTCLIDGGSTSVSGVYRYRMESALKYRGISEIDYVILTHPDTDHISGILEMLEEDGAGSIRIRHILTPQRQGNENYEKLMKLAQDSDIPVYPVYAGMVLKDPQISLRCLNPEADKLDGDSRIAGINPETPAAIPEDTNGSSAVLELRFGDFRALFTGDIGSEEEQSLLDRQLLSDVNLLKVAHHGSRFSTTEEFLNVVHPEASIVSAGVDNRYGHPHPDVLARLKSVGSEIYTTPENGAITVKATAGGTFEIEGTLPECQK